MLQPLGPLSILCISVQLEPGCMVARAQKAVLLTVQDDLAVHQVSGITARDVNVVSKRSSDQRFRAGVGHLTPSLSPPQSYSSHQLPKGVRVNRKRETLPKTIWKLMEAPM